MWTGKGEIYVTKMKVTAIHSCVTSFFQSAAPFVAPSGNTYFIIMSQRNGDLGSYKHIAQIDITADQVRQINGSKTQQQ